MTTEKHLKKSLLFSKLSNGELLIVKKYLKEVTYNKNSIIFSAGDKALALFLLRKGSVKLIKSTNSGKEQLLRIVKPNEQFAEAAMFSGKDYPVTAITETKSTLYSFNKNNLLELIKTYPKIALNMMGAMADLLRHLNTLTSDLKLQSIETRLAKFLMDKYQVCTSKAFAIGCKKQDLAFRLGVTKETLSRTLGKFRKDNIIEVNGNYIQIRDLRKLKKLSENNSN